MRRTTVLARNFNDYNAIKMANPLIGEIQSRLRKWIGSADLEHLFEILSLYDGQDVDEALENPVLRRPLLLHTENCILKARSGDETAAREVHGFLNRVYQASFAIPAPAAPENNSLILQRLARKVEQLLVEGIESQINPSLFEEMPTAGQAFHTWLLQTIRNHRAWNHPYYEQFLRNEANREDVAWFITQEAGLDARFDDMLALLQVGTSGITKMEIAANFWDEMGNGELEKVHTRMFAEALEKLGVNPAEAERNFTLESLISANTSMYMVLRRNAFYKGIGYCAVTEYLAPKRFKHVLYAWDRLDLPDETAEYHRVHVEVDAAHAYGWFRNVVQPLVDQNQAAAREVALGALYRLETSAVYLDRLLHGRKPTTSTFLENK
jgi:pyrroloquinoline quinone (PQQ) biosynthesis protein C